ncbi:hypothetical protein EVAR_32158_1 [Eumeta japonica]|uniref:Uncharacterized protein n=1 Tax=Eumeta variegata TaxID=151549 RepID=A0A4C1VZ48_EUMVA|nr:hypothetical protein EVAR_32158_1 [Eumeta japonica]
MNKYCVGGGRSVNVPPFNYFQGIEISSVQSTDIIIIINDKYHYEFKLDTAPLCLVEHGVPSVSKVVTARVPARRSASPGPAGAGAEAGAGRDDYGRVHLRYGAIKTERGYIYNLSEIIR